MRVSRAAWDHALALALVGWLIIAAVVAVALLWHYLIVAAVVWIGYRLLHPSKRRKSSVAQIITASSAAYAAFNTRWLKPAKFTAKVRREQGPRALIDPDDDTIPF